MYATHIPPPAHSLMTLCTSVLQLCAGHVSRCPGPVLSNADVYPRPRHRLNSRRALSERMTRGLEACSQEQERGTRLQSVDTVLETWSVRPVIRIFPACYSRTQTFLTGFRYVARHDELCEKCGNPRGKRRAPFRTLTLQSQRTPLPR